MIEIGRSEQLFLDGYLIERAENVRSRLMPRKPKQGQV